LWIQNLVNVSIFSNITCVVISKQSWDILHTTYQGNKKVRTVKLKTLRTHFDTLKRTELENVNQFMTRFMGIVNQIMLTSEAIIAKMIVDKVLRSLPNKFDMVVTTILESKDMLSFSTYERMGYLLSHETIINLEDDSMSNAFKNQFSFNRGRGIGRGHRGRGKSPKNHKSDESHTHQNQQFE